MKGNFSNLVKEIDMQVQEVQTVPIMVDAKRLTPKHTLKDKERLLKAREKKLVSGRLPAWKGQGKNG